MNASQTVTPISVDLIIEARWIIPVEPANEVLENHSVVVNKGCILDILPAHEARARYNPTKTRALSEHVLIPGLINAHTHAAMCLMRGIADDLPLMQWLETAIWPREQKYVTPQFVYDGTTLAAAEMLSGGITTCCDMYFFPDAAARAFTDSGMRAVLGMTVLDFPTNYALNADDYLEKGLASLDNWSSHPLLSFVLAPHAPYTVSDGTLQRIATLAEELDKDIHIHLHETAHEISDSLTKHGMRPLQRLLNLGITGPNLHLAHAVHVNDSELECISRQNISISHNPTSNMKLASGIAPVSKMLEKQINVALGTDGAASNNRLDILQEMRLAALLAKVTSGQANTLPAHTALRMATLNGAQALGIQEHTGSIQTGKQADFCAISMQSSHITPVYDIATHLVYVVGRESVTDVWVGGEERVINGNLKNMDNNELLRISRSWQNTLRN